MLRCKTNYQPNLPLQVVALEEHMFQIEGETFTKLHMAPTDQPEPPRPQDTAMQ